MNCKLVTHILFVLCLLFRGVQKWRSFWGHFFEIFFAVYNTLGSFLQVTVVRWPPLFNHEQFLFGGDLSRRILMMNYTLRWINLAM